jgi:hypothetical protein
VIRFSAFLVAVAVGLLVAGVVTSRLVLVYAAIGVSGVALLALGAGALINRRALLGQPEPARVQLTEPEPAVAQVAPAQAGRPAAPWEAAAPAASAWPAAAPSPASAAQSPAAGAWTWRQDAPATQPLREVPRPAPEPPIPEPDPAVTAVAPASPEPADQPPADQPPAGQPPAGQPPAGENRPSAPDEQPPEASPVAVAAAASEAPPPADQEPPEQEPPADQEPPAEHEHAPPAEDRRSGEDQHPTVVLARDMPRAEATAAPPAEATPATEGAPTLVLQREVTVVPGVPRYHNPHCLLIRFMGEGDLEKMTVSAARAAGCSPCRACLPDQPAAVPELGPAEPERQAEIGLDVLPRRLGRGTRTCTCSTGTRPEIDGEHLAGDQPRVLGKGRGHLRVVS